MEITYTISKIHGNYRPLMNVEISLEEWEIALNPAEVSVKILSCEHDGLHNPRKSDDTVNETFFKEIEICAHTYKQYAVAGKRSHKIMLPFRPGKNPKYPEVEQALTDLRDKFEAALLEAHESIAFRRTATIGLTDTFKKKIAPYVAKHKMSGGNNNE